MPENCIQQVEPTPCFKALGICGLSYCPVSDYLNSRGIDPLKPKSWYESQVRTHALYWVCPQSIHNTDLSQADQEKLMNGLYKQLQTK